MALRRGTTSLHRRCQERVALLDLPASCTVDDVVDKLARSRGRPLKVHAVSGLLSEPGSPCGVWLDTGEADHVYYEAATSPFHQVAILCHELGHVISDHPPQPGDYKFLARRLLPDLDPTVVQRVLLRGGQRDGESAQEEEAEMIAEFLLERMSAAATHHSPVAPVRVVGFSRALGRSR